MDVVENAVLAKIVVAIVLVATDAVNHFCRSKIQ
jgi:hypothetical protein